MSLRRHCSKPDDGICLINGCTSAGEGTDPQVVQQLAELVNQGCSTCHNAIRVEGVKVLRLMSTDVSDFSRIKCMRKKSKMSDILQAIYSYLFMACWLPHTLTDHALQF